MGPHYPQPPRFDILRFIAVVLIFVLICAWVTLLLFLLGGCSSTNWPAESPQVTNAPAAIPPMPDQSMLPTPRFNPPPPIPAVPIPNATRDADQIAPTILTNWTFVRFRCPNTNGTLYIEYSGDLTNWLEWTNFASTNSLGAGLGCLVDVSTASNRYYRTRMAR